MVRVSSYGPWALLTLCDLYGARGWLGGGLRIHPTLSRALNDCVYVASIWLESRASTTRNRPLLTLPTQATAGGTPPDIKFEDEVTRSRMR